MDVEPPCKVDYERKLFVGHVIMYICILTYWKLLTNNRISRSSLKIKIQSTNKATISVQEV